MGGVDYAQEAYNWAMGDHLIMTLESAKGQAERNGGAALIEIAGAKFMILNSGMKGGVRFVLQDAEKIIMISTRKSWGVSVRYLAEGLWSRGWTAMRADFEDWIARAGFIENYDIETGETEEPRVSRVDYCMDFQSERFANEDLASLAKNIVTHPKRKARVTAKLETVDGSSQGLSEGETIDIWASPGQIETVTLGSRSGVQIQVYNKTVQISEVAGTSWIETLWKEITGYQESVTVFRLEVRYTKDWLQNRRIRTKQDVDANWFSMWTDALFNTRVVVPKISGKPTKNTELRRWDMHPLWCLALSELGDKRLPPMGKRVLGRRDALRKMIVAQIAGTLRSASILGTGNFNEDDLDDLFLDACIALDEDKSHQRKIADAQARYSLITD